MHLNEPIGVVAHRRDGFDPLCALGLGHVHRQMGREVQPHIRDVIRIADGEGMLHGLLGAKSRRRQVGGGSGATEEPQESRPVEFLQYVLVEP